MVILQRRHVIVPDNVHQGFQTWKYEMFFSERSECFLTINVCVPYSKLSAGVDLVSVVVPRVVEVVANTRRVIYFAILAFL